MDVEPKAIGELQSALNDSAGKASILWTTFITFELYLAIAFGSVTHRNLFLETPIKLPVLNVDLPLVGFFVIAPAILVIFHFYVFLQLLALAIKAKDYEAILSQIAPLAIDRQYLRQRLDSFFVLQFLSGPEGQRTGSSGFWLRIIAWITLVAAPVVILLQAQVTFLPYHLQWVLWVQRTCVAISLVVIWYYWIRVRSADKQIVSRISTKIWSAVGWITTIMVATFSVCIATFPGEFADRVVPSIQAIPMTISPHWRRSDDWTSPHAFLFARVVNEVTGRLESPFSDRLVLTDQSFVVDDDREKKSGVRPSFRGRELQYAVLSRADLREADFTGANLNFALLNDAKLEGAKFGCPSHVRPAVNEEEIEKWPQGGCTWLKHANLSSSQLQGATFESAKMQGASFGGANLAGANLSSAGLQGSIIGNANLQGALLVDAQLQGAFLERSQLWGADLTNANLEIASLYEAQLQGVDITDANLAGSSLDGALIWRISGAPSNSESMTWGGESRNSIKDQMSKQPLTAVEFKRWRAEILRWRSYHQTQDELQWDDGDLATLDPTKEAKYSTPSSVWTAAKILSSKSSADHGPPLSLVESVACGTEGMFEVLSNASIMYGYTGTELRKIVSDLRSSTGCPRFKTLTRENLDYIESQAKFADSRTDKAAR